MKKYQIAALVSFFSLFAFAASTNLAVAQNFVVTSPSGARVISTQQPATLVTPANPQQAANPGVVPAANPAVPGATGAATPPEKSAEDKKVELLLKEKFDRTTGAVLKAWSTKPEKKKAKGEEKKKPVTAVVKNLYEGLAAIEIVGEHELQAANVVEFTIDGDSCGKWKLLSIDGKKISAQHVKEALKAKSPEQLDPPTIPAEQTDAKTEPASETEPVKDSATQIEIKTIKTGDKIVVVKPAPKKSDKPDVDAQVKTEVEAFARSVAIGKWTDVKTELGKMKKENADKVFAHLLKSLAIAPKDPSRPLQRGQKPPKPQLTPDDIMQLSEAAPNPIQIELKKEEDDSTDGDKKVAATPKLPSGVALPPGISIDQLPPEALQVMQQVAGSTPAAAAATVPAGDAAKPNHIAALATLVRNSKNAGHDLAKFHDQIKQGTTHFGGDDPIKRLTAADLFMKSGTTEYVEEFLPKLDDDATKSNLHALKIWSQLALAMHAEKNIADWLDKAWKINQWIIGIEDLETADKNLALANLTKLSSQIDKETGVAWVNESFTNQPDRGMTILTNLGTKSADLANKAAQTPENTRLDLLTLQNEAVEKLIKISPDKAKSWDQTLTLLAHNWLTEAATSLQYSTENSGRDFMEMDMYGNYYWMNQRRQMHNGRQPRPIKLHEILEIAPSNDWQALIDTSLHTNLNQTRAKLFMRINEENKAFPFIEQIAETRPVVARELVHDFLRIWTQNHDPNSSKRRRNPYIYFYGFDRKADAIPLTRSKQERNLEELSQWVQRIRKLPIEDVDEELLSNAFTTCHSSAEVFKLDRFRDVFGDFEKLKPETIAALCQKMRANLASNWRNIRNQEEKQTNRREPEVQVAVLDGYRTAMQLAEEALNAAPNSWRLHLAKATLMYDSNDYSQSVQKSSDYSDRRDSAFEQFKIASNKYAEVVATLEKDEQATDVYDYWFYAALGAVDLGKITDKTTPDLKQYPKIKDALNSLNPELSESHMARFANNLFTRMSPIKPEIKFRYLKGGFEIVGEHPRAYEAKNLYDYYKDLVHEIKFSVNIDGEDNVGHDQPFGAYVNILHTTEIERESGGFGKYVQNQNSMQYAYNYGRPTENYRDKFNDTVEMALGEHFEILNVTFQSADSMKSRPAQQAGWRISPFAYVLLKAKGPEVDRIAPLKLDLDFLDTSGYVVVPVESPALVVDCSAENPAIRPIKDLKITQTIDERQASDGKLILEITAAGKGLVPELDQIIDLERDDFELVSVDDQQVLPSSFEKETDEIQIISDRSWTVEYKAKSTEQNLDKFAFSEPKLEDTTPKYQRYEDADLVEVAQSIDLEKNYKKFSWNFLYWMIPLIVFGLIGLTGMIFIASKPKQVARERFEMPQDVNPFTVLTLLKDIRTRNGISNEKSIELKNSIERIEQQYFGDEENNQPVKLEDVARNWLRQAK